MMQPASHLTVLLTVWVAPTAVLQKSARLLRLTVHHYLFDLSNHIVKI